MARWRQWLENVLVRIRGAASADSEENARNTQSRSHFWKEFRAGQRVADERMAAKRLHAARDERTELKGSAAEGSAARVL
jgi:hypothetical protein